MTPASSLLNFMAKHADSQNVVVKHTEDEIAAINMVIGSAFGGTRSMCATSGGGFALMVEALGFAGVSESAIVVGLFTRPGPATGMPTWTEQSDLRFAIHAAQGEFPRVVIAPGDHSDMFDLTWRALNLADQLQTPVIILGDTYLSDNRQTVPPFDTASISIDRGEFLAEGKVSDYRRYEVTDSGVSRRVVPGVEGAVQLVNSYEHDARGWAAEDADTRNAQNTKRLKKLALAAELAPPPLEFGPRKADMSILLFGTTKMPAREAMKWLEAEGISVNMMQLVTVWPFPAAKVVEFLERSNRSIIIEGNATGQLESLVREHCFREPGHRLHRTDGRPFSPELIYTTIHRILGNRVDLTDAGAVANTEGAR
jgi:2-oxoglutarate ferredoxin oxidoreductase subunit alpha